MAYKTIIQNATLTCIVIKKEKKIENFKNIAQEFRGHNMIKNVLKLIYENLIEVYQMLIIKIYIYFFNLINLHYLLQHCRVHNNMINLKNNFE